MTQASLVCLRLKHLAERGGSADPDQGIGGPQGPSCVRVFGRELFEYRTSSKSRAGSGGVGWSGQSHAMNGHGRPIRLRLSERDPDFNRLETLFVDRRATGSCDKYFGSSQRRREHSSRHVPLMRLKQACRRLCFRGGIPTCVFRSSPRLVHC